MQQLTLADAVGSYQQGVAWKQNQDKIAREAKSREALDGVNNEIAGAVKAAEQEHLAGQRRDWLAQGNAEAEFKPQPFRMDDVMGFDLANRRSVGLMKAGLVKEAVENEAHVQAQRMRVRQSALEQYKATGKKDPIGLVKRFMDTMPNGKSVVGGETIEGAPGVTDSPNIGSIAPIAPKVKIKFSDGTDATMPLADIEDMALRLSDPKFAEREGLAWLEDIKQKLQGNREVRVAGAKAELEGNQARTTLAEKNKFDLTLADANNVAAQRRVDTTAGATLGAARIRADGDAKKAADSNKRDQVFDQLHDELIRGYGAEQPGSMSGARIGDDFTAAGARYARDLVASGLSFNEALGKAAAEVKKRRQAGAR
jgi:hypothetical protein